MNARGLAALVGMSAVLGAGLTTSKHRRRQPNRTRAQKAYRAHANRRRALALASKRRNRGRA